MPQEYVMSWDLASPSSLFTVGNSNDLYIKSHNYSPEKFNLYKTEFDENPLYLGFELEVDFGGKDQNNAMLVYEMLGEDKAYCVHDGSLTNGFEIVTHPMTLDYHKTMPYMDIMDKLTSLKYKSHNTNTCGLHVHFNRDYFGESKMEQDLCVVKLLYMFEKFETEIQTVSRRKNTRYANFIKSNSNESLLDLYAKAKQTGKYCSINLQHKDTIEIRTFKGTLKYETLINTLEFVKTIVSVAKTSDIYKLNELNWEYVLNLCGDSFKEYYLERVEIDKKSNPKPSTDGGILLDSSMPSINIWGNYGQTFFCGNPNVITPYTDDIEPSEVNARTDVEELKIEIKALKREFTYAVGLRKSQLQKEIQKKQRKLNLMQNRR